MRIIAGSARAKRLIVPSGVDLRPTSDRVREALFASLGPRCMGARFADLYAGCGSVGLEALSRGAAYCLFVERDPRCVAALRANLAATGFGAQAEILRADVLKALDVLWQRGPFDIIFMDPPYRADVELVLAGMLERARAGGHPCVLILECRRGKEPATLPTRRKAYGETCLLYYEITEKTDV